MAEKPVVKGKMGKICDTECHKKGDFVTNFDTFLTK